MCQQPHRSTLFPYTTLFRSEPKNSSASIVRIAPVARLRGDFQLPGDKSISHRSAMFAAIGEGVSRLSNYSDRKSTRLNSSHSQISYAVFCLKKKKKSSILYI